MSINDLIFNIDTFDNMNHNAQKQVLQCVRSRLELLREVCQPLTKDETGSDDERDNLPLPWKFVCDDGNDDPEHVDKKILADNGNPVVVTDTGFYPPSSRVADLIVKSVNTFDYMLKKLDAIEKTESH